MAMWIRLNLLRRYPNAIRADIKMVCDTIRRICGKKLEAIILLGSAASGELSYFQTERRLEVLSDYEFLVVLKKSNVFQRTRLLKEIHEEVEKLPIKYTFPSFHIDVALLDKGSITRLRRGMWTYELKNNGKVLAGNKRILELIPNITADNLDPQSFSELLVNRLHEILLYIPKEFAKTGILKDKKRNLIFQYALCRNLLIIPPALLPREKILKSTHRARCAHILKYYKGLEFSKYLGPEFPKFLGRCFRFKLSPNYRGIEDPKSLYFKTIDYFMKSICYILRTSEDEIFEALEKKELFGDFSLKAKLNCILKTKNFRVIFRRNLKDKLLLLYLFLHQALTSRLKDDHRKSQRYLAKSENLLRVFSKVERGRGFIKRWFLLNEKVDLVTTGLYMIGPSLEKQILNSRRWAHE